jgi:hypothetical protein
MSRFFSRLRLPVPLSEFPQGDAAMRNCPLFLRSQFSDAAMTVLISNDHQRIIAKTTAALLIIGNLTMPLAKILFRQSLKR